MRVLGASELDGYRVARCEVLCDTGPLPGSPAHAQLPELAGQVGVAAGWLGGWRAGLGACLG